MSEVNFVDLADWADEWALENNLQYIDWDLEVSIYDIANMLEELGIDTKEKAMDWIRSEAKKVDQE